jgi:hypothetical protein
MPTPFRVGGRQYGGCVIREWLSGPAWSKNPRTLREQHAREPGDLQHTFGSLRRSVREGDKPHDGHVRAGEVGLRRSTCEPAEQGGDSFCGGWGGKGAAEGEHHSTAHAPDSEQEFCMSQRLDDVREANRSLGSLYAIHSSEEPYA